MKNAKVDRTSVPMSAGRESILDSDIEEIKASLARRIVRLLDQRRLSVRSAAEVTGTAAADFSRIRQSKLDRFTVDRLIVILNRFDQHVEVAVNVRSRKTVRTKLVPG